MCGIAGAYAIARGARVDVERVRMMSARVAHRGPDGEGLWVDEHERACLAHRRLSIIDVATGNQPMAAERSGHHIVFNGEIYNYVELRRELDLHDQPLRTTSDTEVLLRLLTCKGGDALASVRGMFAFAMYDPDTHHLLLARDRLGKKPLYHAILDDCLYFASSFYALRSVGLGNGSPQVEAVDEFLELGYIPAPLSIDPGIAKLPAATVLSVRGQRIEQRRFWDPATPIDPFQGKFAEAVDRLDELLGEAVRIRLRSDVPLGVFLSGGIDSSLIAALAARQTSGPVFTFSVGFDEQAFDESVYAEQVARLIRSEHRTFRTRYEALDLLPDLVRHFGEPFGDSSAIPTWQLSKQTRQHVTVALGGDGGDEGFGGYDWYRTALRLRRLRKAIPTGVAAGASRMLLSTRPASMVGRLGRGASLLAVDDGMRFAGLRCFLGPQEAARLYAGELAAYREENGSRARGRLAAIFERSPGSNLRAMRVTDISTYLADDLLPKVDVASMAHALEARAPLLDHKVIEFALSLPDEWITDRRTGKLILRMLASRYLPAGLFERPKQGFSVPLATWFAGELRPLVLALPSSAPLMDTGWFRAEGIGNLVDEHRRGVRDHSQRLFNLLVLEEWLRQR